VQELINEFKTGKVYVKANVEEPFRQCLQKIRDKFRYVMSYVSFCWTWVDLNFGYLCQGDGVKE